MEELPKNRELGRFADLTGGGGGGGRGGGGGGGGRKRGGDVFEGGLIPQCLQQEYIHVEVGGVKESTRIA